jgi:hypothetical protein
MVAKVEFFLRIGRAIVLRFGKNTPFLRSAVRYFYIIRKKASRSTFAIFSFGFFTLAVIDALDPEFSNSEGFFSIVWGIAGAVFLLLHYLVIVGLVGTPADDMEEWWNDPNHPINQTTDDQA